MRRCNSLARILVVKNIEKGNLKNIEKDYNKFVADGCVTSWQKFYHNVIHEKPLDIELEKVSTYYQHIFLFRKNKY